MKLLSYLASLSIVLSLVGLEAADVTPRTERPTGEYRVVRLELNEGLRHEEKDGRSPQVLHLAFRGEKLANWWFIGHGWHAVQQHDDSLHLTDKSLGGALELRCYDARGRLQDIAKLTFQVSRSGETLQGEVGLQLTGHEKQAWKSTVRGSFLKPAERFDPKAQWPSFAGPMCTLQVSPGGPALVEDLARSRPLWRSESQVPVSYGNAADDRYATRAAGCRSGGGSSSPVYADGVVYVAFYVPNRSIDTDWSKAYESRRIKYSGEGFKKLIEEMRWNEVEVRAVEDHWRPLADEVVVAMDARTGKTLWRTTWPLRAYNLQTHKHRGTFGVPLVAGGKVLYPSFSNSLQAMDAKTGKALWEFPKYEKPPQTKHWPKGPPSQSPLLMGETVVWSVKNTTYGLDADTGETLWENKTERFANHSLRKVKLGNRSLVLVVGHQHYKPSQVRVIDPQSGKTLWSQEAGTVGTPEGQAANLLAIAGDKLVAFRYKLPPIDPKTNKYDKSKVTEHVTAWRLSDTGMERLWEDAHIVKDEAPHLAIANGIVYAVGKRLVRCLDLETGKALGEITEQEFPHPAGSTHYQAPGSNPLLIVAGDKLVLSPEGQHGKHGFVLFDADPKKLTLLGDKERKWAPPHATTTAYGRQPIVNPIVDGRMFFRGGNGIYCYDLRKKN